MDTAFRNAVAVSVIVHSAVLMTLCRAPVVMRDAARQKQIFVNYVRLEEPQKPEVQNKNLTAAAEETPKVELRKTVVTKPAYTQPAEDREAAETKDASEDLARKQARIKSTKDYINYYQLIREKIRQRLKVNYRDYRKNGDVNLVFELDSNGRLITLAIENAGSATDKVLRGIAAGSVKEAAPFAPFPKALAIPKMSFNLLVSFKKE